MSIRNLNSRRRRLVSGSVALIIAAGIGSTVAAPTASATASGASIVAVAQQELANSDRNYEWDTSSTHHGSTNCTYYAGQMTSWPSCGPSGWRGGTDAGDGTYPWCAVFAKYVWQQGGVTDLNHLNALAASFKTYGIDNGTWHSGASGYIPQPGDAITFDFADDGDIHHVGIVVSSSGGSVSDIEGNSDNKVAAHTYSLSDSVIDGYASPVGVSVPTRGDAAGDYVTGDVAIVRAYSGVLADYRLGSDGWIWGTAQASVGSAFGPWKHIGDSGGFAPQTGQQPSRPTALMAKNDTIVLYALGTDGLIHGIGQPSPGAAFGSWTTIGSTQPVAGFTDSPSALMTSDGRLVLYATGGDGWVWGTDQTSPGSAFGPWVHIGANGANIASTPLPLTAPNGTIALYARDSDNMIHGVGQSAPGSAFGNWNPIGTGQPAAGFVSDPTAVIASDNTIVVYATGGDGWVWGSGQTSPGSAFGPWVHIGASGAGVASRPQPIVAPNGTIVIYVRGTDNKIHGVGQASPGAGFGTWAPIGTAQSTYTGDPSAQVTSSGVIVIYAAGTDGSIWGTGQPNPGSAFGNWQHIGS